MSEGKPKVAIVGAGVMGAQIAQVLAASGYDVRLHDLEERILDRAMSEIEHGAFGMRASVRRGKMSAEQLARAMDQISPTTELQTACDAADLVIEAVPEDLRLKMKLFKELDRLAPAHTVLASNTAGFPITALAHATDRPEAVVGWHWAQPCVVLRLAEIIAHEDSATSSIEFVCRMAQDCGKNPIVIKDQPLQWGFVANRINARVREEAQKIVEEGVASKKEVDAIVKDCFRWPMGVFEMYEKLEF